eukprot:CAMPEP_0176188948 /NCGR_PEP_ID=MMETSP0121_2-20121125/3179_1 /TAXON_ID=160619 /ORGANISM="Kryptoperidinium foliaceum, Strain CCMP 1326" /LENGTH=237 /DNA_ID=CAMNT_0017527541 /DNA_START=23 /DNA_END=737 /DNA_ORIENTATION=-
MSGATSGGADPLAARSLLHNEKQQQGGVSSPPPCGRVLVKSSETSESRRGARRPPELRSAASAGRPTALRRKAASGGVPPGTMTLMSAAWTPYVVTRCLDAHLVRPSGGEHNCARAMCPAPVPVTDSGAEATLTRPAADLGRRAAPSQGSARGACDAAAAAAECGRVPDLSARLSPHTTGVGEFWWRRHSGHPRGGGPEGQSAPHQPHEIGVDIPAGQPDARIRALCIGDDEGVRVD